MPGPARPAPRRWHRTAAVVAILIVALPFLARAGLAALARPQLYPVAVVPSAPVAMVFGARVFPGEVLSHMLADRVATGADLYHRGRVQKLLMTGDNSTLDYNEPGAMKRYAMRLGVPVEAIVLDYAGRRTYDSCYRARHIFQLDSAILVTQGFHLDRALVLCSALGVDAVGVAADYQRPAGYQPASITYSRLREVPAALAALLDLVTRPEPILGEPLPIDTASLH
jgi:SanA protein